MMQKRTLYLSFLLVTCLLIFGFTSVSAQTVTFASQTAPRCEDVTMNIIVEAPVSISAFDIIFQVSGDYTGSPMVDFTGFTGLETRVGPIDLGGGAYRLSAFKDCDDPCLDVTGPGGVVVGDITFHTVDVCTGVIEVVGAMAPSTACCVPDAYTALIDCPVGEIPTTVVPGQITIENRDVAFVDCPTDTLVFHWGDNATFDVEATDADLATGCETLAFTVISGPGAMTKTGDSTATFDWQTDCPDVGYHTVGVEVMDKCGDADTCYRVICVYNDPPIVTHPDETDTACTATLYAAYGTTVCDTVQAYDPDGPTGCNALLYTLLSFDGPTWYGSGLTIDPATGAWCWDINHSQDYLCDFTLGILVTDGANIVPGCSPSNADTAYFDIHVIGLEVTIEKVHNQLQGHFAEVSIYLDSGFTQDHFCVEIGGFDLLVAYDPSALTAMQVTAGDLIDDGVFEYFTYRFGPFGNCGNGCPSGMLRITGMREWNVGGVNPNHITGPGELAVMHFLVTGNYNFAEMFVPIEFYWIDCGDNTFSDESGNWLYEGLRVYNHDSVDMTTFEFGYGGPADTCYETVYYCEDSIKHGPLGAIVFRNGGIDIIPIDSLDDRGDVNLNGVPNEIADAVVFTNYFIHGPDAFTINFEGQKAATEINGDGVALTVADLVYLVRIIVGDALALPAMKVNPAAEAEFIVQGTTVRVETNVEMGAALLVFDGMVNPTLATDVGHMELAYHYDGTNTRVLVYGYDQFDAINSGDLVYTDVETNLVSVEAAEYRGTTMTAVYKVVPTDYALRQNYPNPFNPTTTIEMELPVASDWTVTIYNVTGQRVADYSGHSNAGIVKVEWNADGAASGLYFYKATAGAFSATKKMVLLK
jgi:hypothetical protein